MKKTTKTLLAVGILTTGTVQAFELMSEDIIEGHPMQKTFEYKGWGVMAITCLRN